MAITSDLLDFVKEGLNGGMSRAAIHDVLIRAGWHQRQVSEALAGFADVESPIAVPRPRPYLSAREAFTCLVLFATLFVSAYSFGALVFDLIDSAFKDPESRRSAEAISASMRWAIAWFVVVSPIFVFMQAQVNREVRRDPARRTSRIRRQLTYATMFVASCVLIGDVTTLIYWVLASGVTTAFLLKVITVAVIAGGGFAYCLRDIRADEEESDS